MAKVNDSKRCLPGYSLALFACAVCVLVVALGAFTRLVDAGLGCPDWPTCYGHVLWPDTAEEIAAANAHPDFIDTPVESHKTWPEQVHRLFASSLGLIGLILFGLALRRRSTDQPWLPVVALLILLIGATVARIALGDSLDRVVGLIALAYVALLGMLGLRYGTSPEPFKLPAFIAGFLVLQGLFGMWTVTLKLWPQVVTAHLLGGFTTLSLLWLLSLRLKNQHWRLYPVEYYRLSRFRPYAVLALIVVVIQIALGGWTTSNYAAVACPDLPTCQAQWLPAMDFAQGFNVLQHIGPNYLGGTMDNEARVAIHFSHRVGAIITLVTVAWFCIALLRSGIVAASRQAKITLAVLLAQLGLGLSNILFNFPLAVAVLHNVVGALLLLTMVTLNYRLFTAQLCREEMSK